MRIPVTLVRVPSQPATGRAWTGPSLAGDWLLSEAGAEGAEKVVLTSFQQEKMAAADGKVAASGILEYVSGDTGLLHGSVFRAAGGAHFHLSRFDGIHVLALDGGFSPMAR